MTFLISILAAPLAAQADGYSTDIELLQPTFSLGAVPGVDSPRMGEKGTWRLGLLTQYEQDPLVLYDSGLEVGAIVEDRGVVQLGGNYILAERAAVQLRLPMFLNAGSETPNFEASGTGFGDFSVGMRFTAVQQRLLSLGVRAEMIAPSGRKDAYMGDSSMRLGGALLAMLDTGPVELMLDTGAVARAPLTVEEDITFGSELLLNGALRYEPVEDHLWLYAGALSRGGLANLWQPASGENPVEAIGGFQLAVAPVTLDVGLGRGLADGYGTTQQRVFAGVTWQPERPEPAVMPPPLPPPPLPPEPLPPEVVPDPPEPTFEAPVILDVGGEQIRIYEPVQFEYNTARIVPESIPTLHLVADLMNDHPEVGQVIIEGHASEEGSYAYNYRLSLERATSVWEALVDAGVDPRRLGLRGMGEVDGIALGENEAQLAAERRVEFHIVQWFDELGNPALDRPVLDPRSGEARDFSARSQGGSIAPQAPAPPPPPVFDPDDGEEEDLPLDLFGPGDSGE